MRDKIVAVDIGASKVVTVIGDYDLDDEFEIIGIGVSKSKGFNSGVVVNMEDLSISIKESILKAEEMAQVSVDSVFLSITGNHISGINSIGKINVEGKKHFITEEEVVKVHDAANTLSIPFDKSVLNIISQEYIVDNQGGISNPVGLSVRRILESKVHIITVSETILKNLLTVVRTSGYGVKDRFVGALIAAEDILKEDEKMLGSLFIDIGSDTLDIIFYVNGYPYYTKVFNIASNYITSDISKVFRISMRDAEKIKKSYGCCYLPFCDDNDILDISLDGGFKNLRISRTDLCKVIGARMEEILSIIYADLVKADIINKLEGSVVLSGGGSLINGIEELAKTIFNKSIRLGFPNKINGLSNDYLSPEYSVVISMINYAKSIEKFDKRNLLYGYSQVKENGVLGTVKKIFKSIL